MAKGETTTTTSTTSSTLEKRTTKRNETKSFSGEVYGKSYPTLERRASELARALERGAGRAKRAGERAREDELDTNGGGIAVVRRMFREIKSEVGEELARVRENLLSAVAAEVNERGDANADGRRIESIERKTRFDLRGKVEVEMTAKAAAMAKRAGAGMKTAPSSDAEKKDLEKKSKELAARERELVARERAIAKAELDAKEKELKERARGGKAKVAPAAASTTEAPAKKTSAEALKVVEAPKEIMWTLAFTAGLGMLGHVFKALGERYHLGGEDEGAHEEWHPLTVWKWMKEKVILRAVSGGGFRLTVRDADGAASKSVRKVGSTSNYIHSINFASHAAPVEAAVSKRVEKTKAHVQNIVEGIKIRSIDELTDNVTDLQRRLDEDNFETEADRLQTLELLEAKRKRLKEARGLLSMWVDQSAHSAYEENLKRKVFTAFAELLTERYRRNKLMTRVFVRWQQTEMTAAFHAWCENVQELKIERLEAREREIQDTLASEKQRLVEKRVADEQRRADQIREAEDEKRAQIEREKAEKAAAAKKVEDAIRAAADAEIEAAKKAVAAKLEETKRRTSGEKRSPTSTPKKTGKRH